MPKQKKLSSTSDQLVPLKHTLLGALIFCLISVFVFTIYLALTAVVFHHRLDTLSTHYTMPDVDTDSGLWFQWYLTELPKHNAIYEVTDLTAYPLGFDISTSPIQTIIYDIHVAILNQIGFNWHHLMLVSNISSLLVYPLSGLSAFWCCYYLIRNKKLSFIFGLYYAFAFYIVYMGRGSMSINHIELIPLVFLSTFYYLDKKTWLGLLLSCAIVALQFKADAYYAFWSCMMIPVIVLFYGDRSLKEKIRTLLIYIPALVAAIALSSFSFISQQFEIMTSTALIKQTGRNSSPLQELGQLIHVLALPVPQYNVLKSFVNGFSYVLYLPVILLPITAISKLINQSRVRALASCWLLSIVLSAYVAPLFLLNKIYFYYFGMFRGVGRLSHFTTLFAGLLTFILIDHYEKKYALNKKKWYWLGLVLFMGVYLLGNLNTDITWTRTTNFGEIDKLYAPLKDLDISAIAPYPFDLSSGTTGFPVVYQLLGQVAHQRPLATGLSVFTTSLAEQHQSDLKDITNPLLINNLGKYGINTIIIYNKLLPEADLVVKQFQANPNLNYIGRYTANSDGSYISASDESRDISVFQLRSDLVVPIRRDNSVEMTPTKGTLSTRIINPYVRELSVNALSDSVEIFFYSPYNPKWHLFESSGTNVYLDILLKNGAELPEIASSSAKLENSWKITNATGQKKYVLMFDGYRSILQGKIIEAVVLFVFVTVVLLLLLLELRKKLLQGSRNK